MLRQLALFIIDSAFSFFAVMLLTRFYLQFLRISFRNQLGQFVIAVTDWLVRPVRRIIPGPWGLDLSCLLLAWLGCAVQFLLVFVVQGGSLEHSTWLSGLMLFLLAFIELVRFSIYLLMGAVIISAVLSWMNPYAPLAPIFYAITHPVLRPFQRLIPPIAGVDLSPMILLLALQVAMMLIAYFYEFVLSFGL